ncbi:hypothetical protein N9P38_00735 [Flavobacteriales bacterium]|nr:hypothetical protein [Flavobacteriales bacterium]MDB4088626.1 hypothetical protein [Flavobacteriales bacterium]
MTEAYTYYLSICKSLEDSEESQMFGKPCFKINKKAFVCFFEDEMVFKLMGESHSEAISLDGSKLFDPSKKGRAMKEWVQVPFHYKEMWREFTKSAFKYVVSKS